MDATGMDLMRSPLAGRVRTGVERGLRSWETSGATAGDTPGKLAVRRFLAALDELAQAADGLATSPGAAGEGSTASVLAVTDDPLLATGLRQRLGSSSLLIAVATPQEATDAAARGDPAVLFAAGRTAGEAVRRVREVFPGIPAVIAAPEA